MNSKLDFIFARRSVRQYSDKKISDETIRDILEAAMAAPSACAKDPWQFIICRDKAMLFKIAEGLPNGKMLASADCGIIVCGDIQSAHSNELSFMLQDCSAAIENILLATSALGLGACWLGVHPRQERIEYIKKLFTMPEYIIPISVIALGYPAENKEARTRYKEDAVHFDKW